MTRPAFYRPSDVRSAFLDPSTGVGVTDGGRSFYARPRAAQGLTLADLADAAAAAGVTRVYLTGGPWPEDWLTYTDPDVSGWVPGPRGHYTDPGDTRLDLARTTPDGPQRVDIRRAASWGLPDDTPAPLAAETFTALERALRKAWRPPEGVPVLLATPTATGQQLAALALPRGWDPEPLAPDLAALVRATSPQHRIETPGSCYGGCDAHRARPDTEAVVTHLDARFAYAALCRELGAGGELVTADRLEEALTVSPYVRGRAHVRYTVPDWWEHPGLVVEKHPDGRHWHAPDRPGYTGQAWLDTSELVMARAFGWRLEIVEGLLYGRTPQDPLRLWIERLVEIRTRAETAGRAGSRPAELAADILRTIALRTIGSMHSTGRRVAHIAASPLEVPPTGIEDRRDLPGGRVLYHTRQTPRGAAAAWARPELSSQIWARAHTRLAVGPGGAGFLSLRDPDAVVGMWGDALYLTTGDPGWPDDGRPGRYRVKGTTPTPVPRPRGVRALTTLRDTIGA